MNEEDGVRIECGSPTCTATVIVTNRQDRSAIRENLERLGWAVEMQPGDTEPRPYCARDREGASC